MLLPCTGIGNDQEKLVSSEEYALCEARERRVAEQSRPLLEVDGARFRQVNNRGGEIDG